MADNISIVFGWIFDGFGFAINFLKSIEIFHGASLFHFIIAVMILGIVITYLINVARSPSLRNVTYTKNGRGKE